MARNVKAAKIAIKGKKDTFLLNFDSKYGSHTNMIAEVDSDEAKAFLGDRVLTEDEVLCKDEKFYVTLKSRLDTGMADPARMYKD